MCEDIRKERGIHVLTELGASLQVEELMFQLILDPSGVVVDTTLKELVPAITAWANKGNQPLSQLLRLLFSHILACAQVTLSSL